MQVLRELPSKNIDTGASVERLAVVLQDVAHAFETDLLRPLVEVAESLSGRRLGDDERDDVSLKVIGEHGRATTFLMADGVQPSNEGRGYIVRRMLRRVVSHARRLGIETGGHAGAGRADGRTVRARVPGAGREPRVRRAGRELGGGSVRRHPAAGDDAVRDRDREGGRCEAAPGRRRVQAPRHVRLPQGAHERARGRGGVRDRRRAVRGPDGGAARAREAFGAERARRGGARRRRRRGRHDRVRRVPDPRVRRTAARADRARRDGSRSRPRARRSASSWTGRRSTRSPAARSATRAWSGRPAGRSP